MIARRLQSLLLTSLAVSGLISCSSSSTVRQDVGTVVPNYSDLKPEVYAIDRVHVVNAVSEVRNAETDAFFSAFIVNGGDAIHAIHSSAVDPKLVAAINRRALANGLSPSEVTYQVENGVGVPSVTLTYKAYQVTPIACPKTVAAYTANPSNQSHPTFGCTVHRGIATMVSNPRDFVMPRPETAPDGVRRTKVIDKYRKGEPSDAERSPYANSGISDVGGN